MKPNYIVTVQGFRGKKTPHCETEEEVSEALGRGSLGALYSVTSPTGKCVAKYIPY